MPSGTHILKAPRAVGVKAGGLSLSAAAERLWTHNGIFGFPPWLCVTLEKPIPPSSVRIGKSAKEASKVCPEALCLKESLNRLLG